MRRRARLASVLAVLGLGVAVLGAAPPASLAADASHVAETAEMAPQAAVARRAPRWDALFDRTSGWTGADGIYSIPLDGDELPGQNDRMARTFWVFSDTFIGEVNESNQRLPGTTLINNTMAVLKGDAPRPARIEFFNKTDPSGAPAPQVVPDTSDEHWFWPNDGIAIDGTTYLYSLRMKTGDGGVFNFAVDGMSLLTSSASGSPPFETYDQVDAPLYLPADEDRGEVHFGQALMPNTAAAGAPEPDGYLYVYGLQNDLSKKLLVARVQPTLIDQFSAYRYWDGTGWTPSIAAAVPVTSRLSSEFSVSPLEDGRYILVFQLDGLSADVAVRYGDSPVGPWTAPTTIWTAPEANLTPDTFVYNAKAHPHLSRPGELLISYNVNTFDFFEHFANADIYRPRFIRMALP